MGRKRKSALSEGKRNVVRHLIEMYGIKTAADVPDAFLLPPTLTERRENAMLISPTAMGITKFDLRSPSKLLFSFSYSPVKVELLCGAALAVTGKYGGGYVLWL